ncbi:cyclin-dependent kinase 1-like isoform X2 [Symsagittifera roscoffensis]|uniref:cyclin-dependent kinase 1-like isoform X2 n=1 Tax=Symsagittifera roscoffensis TaxID=84072 RepID=UPI00307B2177
MPLIQGTQKSIHLEYYTLHSPNHLGSGMFGKVFEAYHNVTNARAAVKMFTYDTDEGTPPTALREVAILKWLSHPNIVTVYDHMIEDGNLYLVMECLETDLKNYLHGPNGGLAEEELMDEILAKSYMYQILNATCYCHMRGIFHRDLKPQNLLLNNRGQIKLCDFGLARTYSLTSKRYTHEVMTMWYRAPEILLGSKTYGSDVDLWSIGVILYEMLNKSYMFTGDCEIDQLYKIFQVLGTPNENVWKGVGLLKYFDEFVFPQWEPQSWDSILTRPNKEAADLLKLLLTYNPSRRISAKAALHQSYFDDLDRSQQPLNQLVHYPLRY